MKKFFYFFNSLLILLLSSTMLLGCRIEEYSYLKAKPNDVYYTKKLYSEIKDKDISVRILETTFYKEVILKDEHMNLMRDFIKEVNNDIINKSETINEDELPDKSLYKIYIDANKNNKYIIEVYGDDFVTIFPWDGIYEKDILKLDDFPISLKPEALCKYILSL